MKFTLCLLLLQTTDDLQQKMIDKLRYLDLRQKQEAAFIEQEKRAQILACKDAEIKLLNALNDDIYTDANIFDSRIQKRIRKALDNAVDTCQFKKRKK